ncbi:MAG: glutathione peroxidase [Bacilli bacterium]|nr:glutathione peroxidase [Bacilli bacterium]
MPKTIYNIDVVNAKGELKTLQDYQGKPLLIVNVASKCGFTPQYEGLEALNETYKDKGLQILGFPSNDFGGQEPGTMEEIEQFCKLNYGVTFSLFDKVHAIGDDIHPLYDWLTSQSGPKEDVKWNFEKFLISKDGEVIGRYSSKVAPNDAELLQAIEKAL